METLLVILMSIALTSGAIQPSPVYHRSLTVPSVGKSLPATPSVVNSQAVQQPAEERESGGFAPIDPNSGANPTNTLAQNSQTPAASQSQITPQSYKIVYYPNPSVASYNPNTYGPVGNNGAVEPSFWKSYRMNEVMVGVASLGLVAAGGFLLFPKLSGVRARALRELSEIKSEDANSMAKSVLKAIERFYEMNNAE